MKILLDEHLWPGLVRMILNSLPDLVAASVHEFDGGALVNQPDALILERCHREGWTLLTFDVNTIPAELRTMAMTGADHSGVVFLSSKSFAQNDYKSLAKAIVTLVNQHGRSDWTNRTIFLSRKANPDGD